MHKIIVKEKELILDYEDYLFFKDKKIYLMPNGYMLFYSRELKTTINVHRFVTKAKKGELVDHINRNRLDCRKENLRLVDSSKNQANKVKSTANTSGYKGVYFVKKDYNLRKPWFANIEKRINGKRVSYKIGGFLTKEEAALAYNKKAIELFGEYALLNIIENNDGGDVRVAR